jgi:murein DD-endopeptidase MepM/ murein hydrolase activator NlpD
VKSRRYTIVVADRTTGVVRRFTISLRPTLTAVAVLFSLPVLVGLGARWSALAEVNGLRTNVAYLEQQNNSFRSMTAELAGQVEGVQNAINDLTENAKLDPDSARALAKLPASVKNRAMGGSSANSSVERTVFGGSFASPDDTFGPLLQGLGRLTARLEKWQENLDQRAELLNATPSIWPARGPISAFYGTREDPFGRGSESHTGIDISADRGTPVWATADGTVDSAGWNGDYGNMVVLNHRFGMVTRYAHLSSFSVRPGEKVTRGQLLGLVGATGRSTGPHLHYELIVNGQLTNPLTLLSGTRRP